MAMKTIQIRLTHEQLEDIDRKVKQGIYQSRSEAIRDYIRKAEFFDALIQFRKLVSQAGLKEEDIWDDAEEIRKALYEKLFGKSKLCVREGNRSGKRDH